EAGTFLVAAAIAGSEVTILRAEPRHLKAILDPLTQAGFSITSGKDSVTLRSNGDGQALQLETSPYPGFPTDMQAQMCALLATIEGISVVTENVFPQRFMHVAELKRMGANIELQGPTAVIQGVEKLSGAPVMASDLRASAALVLAGLKAENSTEINRVYHIDRGYESLDEKLNALGAQIERVKI
ncbi:MAG TPA: UDP-N-acetylglucosamine 1-carboxyvinyltransferase, partial [Terrimicrobiaceae bacterium]